MLNLPLMIWLSDWALPFFVQDKQVSLRGMKDDMHKLLVTITNY